MGTYRKRLILILLLAIAAVGISFIIFVGKRAEPVIETLDVNSVSDSAAVKGKKTAGAFVYITGAVNQPGVYPITGQKRVSEVLILAGGFAPEADSSKVNLVKPVKDGMHIHVPARHEAVQKNQQGKATDLVSSAGVSVGRTVSVNSGSVQELAAVKGIGPVLAEKIILYRQEHGAFSSLADLGNVKGITPAKLSKLQDKLTL